MLKIRINGVQITGFILMLALASCRLSEEPVTAPLSLSHRVTWNGQLASTYSDSLLTSDSLQIQSPFRLHQFGFFDLDTTWVRLYEYGQGYAAYAAFQELSSIDGLAMGYYREGVIWRFHHGRFLGELASPSEEASGETILKNLGFQSDIGFAKPREFEAFPLLGRIPNSERVIKRHFLGLEWRGPVITVAYRCHGDSATAFRAFAQEPKDVTQWIRAWKGRTDTLDWGREIHFQGQDEFHRPLIFWNFHKAVMGFEGCYDLDLSLEYAEKMKKTAIFWPKP